MQSYYVKAKMLLCIIQKQSNAKTLTKLSIN